MTPDWIQWILGVAITVIGGFVVFVYKDLKANIKSTQEEVDGISACVNALNTKTDLLSQKCQSNHTSDIREADIRRILKDELGEIRSELLQFKQELKVSIIKDIKIALFEGEIIVPAKRKSPTKKKQKADAK